MKLFSALTVLFFVTQSFANGTTTDLDQKVEQLEKLKTSITQIISNNNKRVGYVGDSHIDANYEINIESIRERLQCEMGSSRNFIAPNYLYYAQMNLDCEKSEIVKNTSICNIIKKVVQCKLDQNDAQHELENIRRLELFNIDSAQKQSVFFYQAPESLQNTATQTVLSTYDSLDQASKNLPENRNLIQKIYTYGSTDELNELKELLVQAKIVTNEITKQSDAVSNLSPFTRMKATDLVLWASFFRVTILTLNIPDDAVISTELLNPWRMTHLTILNPPRYIINIDGISTESVNTSRLMKKIQLKPENFRILD